MKIVWNTMNRREKLMVIGGGTLIVILLLYVMILKPVHDEYVRLRVEVPAKTSDLQWMRRVADEIGGTPVGVKKGGASLSPLKRIDQTARQHNISTNLERVEPVGESGVKLWFDNVFYTDFLGWLRALVTGGIFSVGSLSVEPAEDPGHVTVRLSLEQR